MEKLIREVFKDKTDLVFLLMRYARGEVEKGEVEEKLRQEVETDVPFCKVCGCMIIFPLKKGEKALCVECKKKVEVKWTKI